MTTTTMNTSTTTATTTTTIARRLVHRTRGQGHGGITRLMSPGDLGELVKPFVFLDHFELDGRGPPMPVHPHSGIATHTTLLRGGMRYDDSTGKSGHLGDGSIEYMQAGGGVWHGGGVDAGKPTRGFQLWLALPAALELAPAESHYVDAASVPGDGRVRVLLGSYGAMRSPIAAPSSLTYLHVTLQRGEVWRYEPAADHDVAWLAVSTGTVRAGGASLKRELAIFEEGGGAIDVVAESDSDFVIASGAKHPHELVMGSYSVHTSEHALLQGEAGYRRIALDMKKRSQR